MSILVTGGAGVLGAEVVAQLVEKGERVVVVDSAATMPRLDHLAGRIEVVCGDIAEPGWVAALVRGRGLREIYHLAAVLGPQSEQDPAASYRSNVQGTQQVIEAALGGGGTRLFFASTTGTYGPVAVGRVSERTPQRPTILYGVEKQWGEQIGAWYANRRGLDFRCIRYTQIIAPGSRIAWVWLPQILEDAIAGRRHVADWITPDNLISLTYIRDAGRAALEMMAAPLEQIRTRTCIVVGRQELVSTREVASYLAARYPGFEIEYKNASTGTSPLHAYDDGVARAEWGWRARWKTLSSVVRQFHRDLEQCPRRFGL